MAAVEVSDAYSSINRMIAPEVSEQFLLPASHYMLSNHTLGLLIPSILCCLYLGLEVANLGSHTLSTGDKQTVGTLSECTLWRYAIQIIYSTITISRILTSRK